MGEMDLTPRPTPPAERVRPRATGVRRIRLAVVAVLLVGALGFLLFKGLSDATLFFYNADEAVAQRDDLGDRRFRLQGQVVPDTVVRTADGATFDVEHDGVVVSVVHTRTPERLFQPGIRVVVEGHWAGDHFASDEMIVKHSNEYLRDNPERVDVSDPARPGPSAGPGS